MKRLLALLAGLSLSAAPGPQVLTFLSKIDISDQPYALYVPNHIDPAKKYPLVMSLHGEGSNHRLNLRRVFGKGNLPGETEMEATRAFPKLPDVDYFVASPLARGTMGYQGIAAADVYAVLADVRKRYPIDEDRIYLTGLAMGGGGALWLGLTRPDVWAAIAAVCPEAPEEARALAPNALNVPVHLFHGSLDPVLPAEGTRRWQHDLLEAGVPVEYTEYPAVRHNAWDSAYKNAGIFGWFGQFRRNRFPDRVRFVTDRYLYRGAYWVEIDGLTPGTQAAIDARFTGPNQLAVRTSNLDGFTLKLKGHPKYRADRPLSLVVDGVRMRPARVVSFVKSSKGWQAGRYLPPETQKRPGSEGPIARAVAAQQVYVYGTAGSPSPEALLARKEQALAAADWSTSRSKLALSFRAIADKEVTPADWASSNLILLGTKETNEQIAKLDPQLPLSLNVSAADFGLLFVYPVKDRYVLINSGLPWWTGAEQAKRPGLPFVPEKLRVLQGLGDYILFRGSLEDVVAEGQFGRDWKLSPAEAERMQALGSVRLNPASSPSAPVASRPARSQLQFPEYPFPKPLPRR